MLPSLSGRVQEPASGRAPRQLVLLLHGLGADGSDLIGLAPSWAPLLPDAAFIAPDAPFPCDMAPFGRQWFSLQDRSPAAILAGVRAAAPILDAFIGDALAKRHLDERNLALVGFSQGTMMSLYVGLRRATAPAGIVGFSGALIGAETLAQELRSRPPVLLVHGDADDVVPPQALPMAVSVLEGAGVPVESLSCPGLGHGIDEAGLQRGGEFLRTVLGG
ncbi:MAG TPA: prolyl oligopeptidase family serine peptidase [Stellaceae bacterium]|nr:prolyl oligopeptidase family serine peptidase [Stellaceae bacterium]